MEASALPASVGLARARLSLGAPLLRLRSDEQLVSLFRAGNEDAFRVIHDRYRSRLLAYTRQMLAASPGDAEDAVQEIFVRAYAGLRTHGRDLALRAWLYRIAHNRCVDELRRPRPIVVEEIEGLGQASGPDPHDRAEEREALARLIADVRRLPEQQRSALLMRELGGMPYADVSGALGVTVPAVKSLLVRARVGLAQASEARDTTCAEIREGLILSHDRGVRSSGLARRHMRDCPECRRFRSEVRGVSHKLSLLVPALGPVAVMAKVFGFGGSGAAAGSTAAAGTGAVVGGTGAVVGGTAAVGTTTGVIAGGSVATVGAAATGVTHVVTIIAATVVAAGGAIGIQHAVSAPPHHHRHHVPARIAAVVPSPHTAAAPATATAAPSSASPASSSPSRSPSSANAAAATVSRTTSTVASANTPHAFAGRPLRRAVAAEHTVAITRLGSADPAETGLPLSGGAGAGTTPAGPTTTVPATPVTTTPVATTPVTVTPVTTTPVTTTPVTTTVPVATTPTTPVTTPVTTTPGATTTPSPTTTVVTTTSPTLTEPVTTPAPTSTTGASKAPVKLTPASGSGGAAVRGKARVIAKHAGTSASWTATGH